ncbi:hypothetical protein KFK09_023021 [Dendrobium nobile]|uniref:Uncharacterized protein n=1 Tax=Dendrobium nobile TaxID=94219 RepID=A0A8T3AKA7_DENNO|nr:hypothetical protein KFK09_023021 [Dendrobium nobile]
MSAIYSNQIFSRFVWLPLMVVVFSAASSRRMFFFCLVSAAPFPFLFIIIAFISKAIFLESFWFFKDL